MTLFDDEIRQPCSAENVASVIVELLERPNLNGLFHWAGKEEISRYELGLKILEHFGFEASRIQKSIIEEFFPQSTRPSHLSFELAPLVGKLKTKPQSIDQQIEGSCFHRISLIGIVRMLTILPNTSINSNGLILKMQVFPFIKELGVENMATDWWLLEQAAHSPEPSFRHYAPEAT